ncbi:membrane protein [[Pantoea] beijingensis]|uniref:Membrane protein n=1 Tax=[Pantoea] beijingensis TaxID=1324864 RepID=A0A443ID00_9GAMM|nr:MULTISPECIES: protein YgfX [Erwiniaceae]RWR01717.1 membrane protein [[Pantoea] beijingensis]
MARWQSNLRVSRCAKRVSLALHGGAILFLVLAPWPPAYIPVWVLLFLMVLECCFSLRRIERRQGEISLLAPRLLYWRQQEWLIVRSPWISPQGILLSLRSRKGQRECLWLMRDSMSQAAWHLLRQGLLTRWYRER